ncbi:natural resistance-associated macrophage protein [Rhexocercosporidium sp. MPI-PUGE-AT-0058]|nr:natural resistance-associated macrophage protein [Rhexocercosporidium sp. MPI-PUGE-AT-0058]
MREGEQGNGSGEVPSTGINEKGSSDAHATQCSSDLNARRTFSGILQNAWRVIRKFGKFIGPGYIIAVAYIDPGNYSTDILAGATYRFKLLFIILLSNLFAIFLQTLCIKLGTVTGLNLAEHCREHLPRWLNYTLYVLAESAIIATDITEVIGSAIALNLLLNIPLVAGCALTLVDVLIILLFYNTSGSMRKLRYFEYFVIFLVLGVMMCFFIQLSYIEGVQVAEVFKGYLPSSSIVEPKGLYLSCGIIGATVMPHSLYVGSGVVQARLHEFDIKEGNIPPEPANFSSSTLSLKYRPSLSAIRNCLNYSVAELVIALFTFALFVNSAILITAGASLNDDDMGKESDLFAVHDLLSNAITPAAGTIFAVSLLLSGTSAGIVATIAGQMVSEGSLNWTCSPWLRRLITRSISITPSIIIAAAVGRNGLTAALNASQIVMCAILPFVSAPLIYFTCRNKYMTVSTSEGGEVKMRNHWFTATVAVLVWLTVVVMDVSLLVLIATGKGCMGGSCHNQFIV